MRIAFLYSEIRTVQSDMHCVFDTSLGFAVLTPIMKRNLINDCQQFNQYQQYEQSCLASNNWIQNNPRYMTLIIRPWLGTGIIWNSCGHECSWIWKLSADFMLIQYIKIVSICLGRNMSGTTFLGSNLVSFLTRLPVCKKTKF